MLTGREQECQKLKQMIEDGLKRKNHLSIYVSGAPGTGKTATTRSVLNSLKDEQSFHLISINCVSTSKKTDVEREILIELGRLPKRVVAYSGALATAFSESKKKIIIVLDEIDHLMSKGNNLLYSAFAWPKETGGNVIVIGIANSIDLTERLVPKLKQQGIQPKCFVFHPYNKDQLVAILKNYLTEQTMDEKSIELCARKVASQTGDIRMALSIANKVLQEIEEEEIENKPQENPGLVTPKKNTLRTVMKVFNQVSASPAARATLPEHSKIILAVLIKVAGKTSSREMTKPKLMAAYDKACKILKISAVESEEWIRALENLETMGIVRISGAKQGTKIKFVDEIEQARAKICDHALIASIEDIMRPLTDEETEKLFKKLSQYIGDNVRLLIDREDGNYCFRLHKDRVYYCSEDLMRKAACVAKKELLSFGTCIGKFTKSQKFFIHITALDYLAPYAKYRVWLKPSAEQQFLYGNNVTKSGVGRMTEGAEAKVGVVVYNMNEMPLGFGVLGKGTAETKHADPVSIIVLHQCDLGEYIRDEATLT